MDEINLEGNIQNATPIKSSSSMNSQGMLSSLSSFDINNLKPQEWIKTRRASLKPWNEFISFGKFKKPTGVGQIGSRLVKNLTYFQTNYLFVFVFLAIYCVLTSPLLLFSFMAMAGACYIIQLKSKEQNFRILGKEMTLAQVYTALGLISIPVFLIAGAGSAVFWIIGASIFCIALHGAFYSREDEDPFTIQMNIV